jgi:hypothetical protein
VRVLQGKKEYNQAIPSFKKALKWMDTAIKVGGYSIEAKNYTQLRLIETLQESGQYMQAKQRLEEVNVSQVDKNSTTLFLLLKSNELSN